MRIIGHMVTKNEMHRWLTRSLPWLANLTDGVALYDDQSDDDTVNYARRYGVTVERRPDRIAAFVDDESAFRGAAWRCMEASLGCEPGDWILAVDADEFLVTTDTRRDPGAVHWELLTLVEEAEAEDRTAITFRVPEVFGFDDSGTPQIRTDGYWANIVACRLVKWRPNGTFNPRKEAGGSVPTYRPLSTTTARSLALLHLGYATPQDQTVRHDRYTRGSGHNPVHVASILRPPSLQSWHGMNPLSP